MTVNGVTNASRYLCGRWGSCIG